MELEELVWLEIANDPMLLVVVDKCILIADFDFSNMYGGLIGYFIFKYLIFY